MQRLQHDKLKQIMVEVLREKGVNEDSIRHVTDSVVSTSLRGTDSHGINLFPHYCRAYDSGRLNKNPQFEVNQTSPTTAIIHADHSIGHHVGAVAMQKAIDLAKESGMAAVGVKHSTHFGAAAYFGLMAPPQGCIGFAFTASDSLAKTHGAKTPFLGTNPICFTAPLADEEPFCLDTATTIGTWNRVMNHRRQNEALPEGHAFDAEGRPTTDPHAARSLTPIGGYKGYGLGLMVDILCSALVGSVTGGDMLPMYSIPIEQKRDVGHFFMAIDLTRFRTIEDFSRELQAIVNRLRTSPAVSDTENVMVPGDPEKRSVIRRSWEGIPIHASSYEQFLNISPKFEQALVM